jgi:signal transduction histidine kinase
MTPRRWASSGNLVAPTSRFSPFGLELLAEAGRRLNGPLDLCSVLGRISAFVVPQLADWYILALTQADGHLRAIALEHRDPARRPLLGDLTGATLFDRPSECAMANAAAGVLGWLPRLTVGAWNSTATICDWNESEFAQLGTGSVICAPLALAGGSIGALLLAREADDGYDRPMVELVAEVARRAGFMVANACRFEALQEELQQVQETLAIAAHELRTPIAAMRGFAQLLLRQFEPGAVLERGEAHFAIARIHHQAVRLASMVDRLIDSASLETGKLDIVRDETDVRELVFDVVDLARAGSPDRLVTVDAPYPVRAELDALRVEQVLSNLLDNAFKFSPSDSPVEISLRARPGFAVVAVRDHGIGVPLDQRQQIFDRFVQAHRDRTPAGLGLGLYVSQHIVEQHGGRLIAEYPPDGGAQFVVELPMLGAVAAERRTSEVGERGGLVHDTARAQPDWSSGSHPRRRTSTVRASRVHRPAGVSGTVAASAPP